MLSQNGYDLIQITIHFGHVELEQRYVYLGCGVYECQSRRKDFDKDGLLISTGDWEPISRIENVAPELAFMLHRSVV